MNHFDRLSIISASNANMNTFRLENPNRTVLSVKFLSTVKSYSPRIMKSIKRIIISGDKRRSGAKYIPVRKINCVNLIVSRIGLIWLLPMRFE